MKKYVAKDDVVEVMTFAEFVQFGRDQLGASVVDGVPWAWTFDGCHVSHERDDHYLISTANGTLNFRSHDVMVKTAKGLMFPMDADCICAAYVEVK